MTPACWPMPTDRLPALVRPDQLRAVEDGEIVYAIARRAERETGDDGVFDAHGDGERIERCSMTIICHPTNRKPFRPAGLDRHSR